MLYLWISCSRCSQHDRGRETFREVCATTQDSTSKKGLVMDWDKLREELRRDEGLRLKVYT